MSLSRNKFYLISLLLGLIMIYIFTLEAFSSWSVSGAMNKGHEKLSCVECHQPAKGTTRQQIQSNVKYWLGFITEATPFGYITPDNKDCLSCHEREDDNHPVYRFNEPKFSKARKAIHPEHCSSCHQEHNGVRVTSKPTNCKHCHKDLRLKEDKISPSHETLIKDKVIVGDFGEKLYLDNIESHIKRLKVGKDNYRQSHQYEIDDLNSIFKATEQQRDDFGCYSKVQELNHAR